ncbi:uncharacterized protein LOC117117703 [Anneissia japonica]|uniref:uncharacterized protein LOC117117703 n=1 Tax=Anneissia japonica TaxID=1529436 RepID=UPI00142573C0|nr:uncharacterized protein LOC117117703 [Anneissia japonica]
MTRDDLQCLVKAYLDKKGRRVERFKNMPGPDFVRSFVARNKLTQRTPGNIKRSRARVNKNEVIEYFSNLEPVIANMTPERIFNYDENNITDDPKAKKVIVPRGMRRVERVMGHSKMAISLMVCGSASGELLPPFVIYKAANLYECWMVNGPLRTRYDATASGWFDMDTFQRWFF